MALPDSFDFVFVPGSIVPSAFLNNVQTQIIDLHTASNGIAGKRARARTFQLGAADMIPDDPTHWKLTAPDADATGSSGGVRWERTLASGATALIYVDIPLDVGDTWVSYKAFITDPDHSARSSAVWQDILKGVSQEGGTDTPDSVVSTTSGDDGDIIVAAEITGVNDLDEPFVLGALVVNHRLQLAVKCTKIGFQISGVNITVG